MDLFASQNYSTVTIKDIADATGTNASLIYYYFDSKETLFRKVVETTADEAYDTFVAIRNQAETPVEIISLWIRNHFLQFPLMRKLIKISIDYASTHDRSPEIDKAINRFYDIERDVLGRAIRLGIQQGSFAAVDVEQTTAFVSTFLDGVLVRSVMMEDFSPLDAIETLTNFILHRLQYSPC